MNDDAITWQEDATKTDQNWREHMLQALKEGKLTTTITFNETKYLITLQPLDDKVGNVEGVSLCVKCGQVVLKSTTSPRWYHQNPRDGNHAAVPQLRETAPTAAEPVKIQWTGPRCAICGVPAAYNGAEWQHFDMAPRDHEAQVGLGEGPKIASPASIAVNVADPLVGTQSTCKMCGKPIVYVGPFWQHQGLLSPRHPAVPADE